MFINIDFIKNRIKLTSVTAKKLATVHKLIVNGYLYVGMKQDQSREFWREISTDEIHWWVFKKEVNIIELKKNTEKILSSAKILKDDSKKLAIFEAPSYSKVIDILNKFVEDHDEEITAIYDYVEKLHKKDVMAPSILFTYRVWGTSDQLDRTSVNKSGKVILCKDLQECIETVLGTVIRSKPTADRVAEEMRNRSNLDDSEFQDFIESSKGADRWLMLTSQRILERLNNYFDNILQSLRNILLEIELYGSVDNLLSDRKFWSDVILSTLNHPIETQLWDFKETLEMWHTRGEEKEKQIIDFCEQVASFANSKGGVILIGVTDKRPRRIIGVGNAETRIKNLDDVISNFCIYPKQFTTIQQVPIKGQNGTALCIVVAIAQTKGVVSVVNNQGMYSYPKRHQTGKARVDQKMIEMSKMEVLKDNYNFISELYKISHNGQFISYSYQ